MWNYLHYTTSTFLRALVIYIALLLLPSNYQVTNTLVVSDRRARLCVLLKRQLKSVSDKLALFQEIHSSPVSRSGDPAQNVGVIREETKFPEIRWHPLRICPLRLCSTLFYDTLRDKSRKSLLYRLWNEGVWRRHWNSDCKNKVRIKVPNKSTFLLLLAQR